MQPGTAVTSQQCRDDGHPAHCTLEMESSIKQGTATTPRDCDCGGGDGSENIHSTCKVVYLVFKESRFKFID